MAIRNITGDLNNHLFEQLERLNNDDLTGEELKDEINRSKAVASIASNIIGNAAIALRVAEFKDNALDANAKVPKITKG